MGIDDQGNPYLGLVYLTYQKYWTILQCVGIEEEANSTDFVPMSSILTIIDLVICFQ